MLAYDQAVARENTKGMKLVTCWKCGDQVEFDSEGTVMECLECGEESCVQCGEASHIPLKCAEVKKKSKLFKK